jgi:predicted ABC-type transport system involved in lysophospholipase L1 biosynthesis ATPase subunit
MNRAMQAICTLSYRHVSKSDPISPLEAIDSPSRISTSTLLNIFGELDTPASGEAFWRDHNLVTAGEAELTRYRREDVG